jgi:hypothetical protein
MQQSAAEALIAAYGWSAKVGKRPLQNGGISQRLYAAKMAHICNVAQLPGLSEEQIIVS